MSRRGLVLIAIAVAFVAVVAAWLWLRPGAVREHDAALQSPRTASPARPPRPRLGRFALPDAETIEDDQIEFGAIAGIVRDWDTDAPVPGAELTFLDDAGAHSIVSGDDGRFVFVAPDAGTYGLASVLADDYQPYLPELGQSAVRFVARPGRRVDGVQIHLVPVLELDGRVVTANGNPVPGAEIRMLGIGTGETALADTEATWTADASGRFRFSAPLSTWLEARHSELGAGRAEVDERALATRTLQITLDREAGLADATIAGIVLDPDGRPLPGARVVAGASAFVPTAEAVSDDDGAFTIRDLVPGEYRIEASHPDYASVWTPKLPTGTRDLRLQLSRGGSIEGTIRGDDDTPISGATVVALRHTEGIMRVQQARVTVFDADGSFRIGGLPPGLYDVTGVAHGRGVDTVTNVDVDADPVSVDLRLPAGHRILGRVVDERTGAPLPASRVELERHLGRGPSIAPVFAAAITDEGGEFEIRGVEPGRHSVTAYARGHVARTLSGIEIVDADAGPLELELAPDDGDGWAFDFAGIGIVVAASSVDLEVREVLPGGGADRAGVLAADRITAVDGIPVSEYAFSGAVEALRGMEGTEVELRIVRGDEELDVVAIRRRVQG